MPFTPLIPGLLAAAVLAQAPALPPSATAPATPAPAPGAAPAPAPAPGAAQGQPVAPFVPQGEFKTADDLLITLEKADAGLKTFDAEIMYDRRFALQGDEHIRTGKIFFSSEPEPAQGAGAVGGASRKRTFAVKFDHLVIDGKQSDEPQTFIFDGQWFIEKKDAEKRFTKHQIALPGQHADPLKLGEGPFPIPIGQKRDDIAARYENRLADVNESLEQEEQSLRDFVQGCTQLVLNARGSEDDLREVRLWYKRDAAQSNRLLPRMARTINMQGDTSIVQLVGLKVNDPGFPADAVSIAEPGAADGWNVQVELKRGAPAQAEVPPANPAQ